VKQHNDRLRQASRAQAARINHPGFQPPLHCRRCIAAAALPAPGTASRGPRCSLGICRAAAAPKDAAGGGASCAPRHHSLPGPVQASTSLAAWPCVGVQQGSLLGGQGAAAARSPLPPQVWVPPRVLQGRGTQKCVVWGAGWALIMAGWALIMAQEGKGSNRRRAAAVDESRGEVAGTQQRQARGSSWVGPFAALASSRPCAAWKAAPTCLRVHFGGL
jgi:hypothetical protein